MSAASHTILIWNVETYGSLKGSRGADYSGLHAFITSLITSTNAEVLLIEEFKSPGRALIGNLAATLGPTWSYDYIPGALIAPYEVGVEVEFDDLNWGSNAEGYAVVWRDGSLKALGDDGQSKGRNGDPVNGQFLALNIKGVEPEVIIGASSPFTWGGPTVQESDLVASGFPVSSSGVLTEGPADGSARLAAKIDYEQRRIDALDSIIRMEYCRRPCICNFQFPSELTATILAYHTPVESTSAEYAVQLCGLSAQVVLVNSGDTRKLILGGDFNLKRSSQIEPCFTNFYYFGLENSAGHGVYPPSSVHYATDSCLAHPNVKANFMGSPRDQILSRNFVGSSGGVFDVIEELHTNGDFATAVLGNAAIKAMVDSYPPNKLPNNPDWIAAWQALKDCFTNGHFDTYLSCVMLFRGYISDHMPLIQRFTR